MPEKIIKETVRKDGEVEKKEVKVKDKLQSEFNQWIPYHVVTIRLYKKNQEVLEIIEKVIFWLYPIFGWDLCCENNYFDTFLHQNINSNYVLHDDHLFMVYQLMFTFS